MYCPLCGEEIADHSAFHCGALLAPELVTNQPDTEAISQYRHEVLRPKVKAAKKGTSPGVWARCAAWRVATREAFGDDVAGYPGSLNRRTLSVIIGIIAANDDTERVRAYRDGRKVPWHGAMEGSSFTVSGDPPNNDYLKAAVEFGGRKSGILELGDDDIRENKSNSIGPVLEPFLPALIVTYDVDLTTAYDSHGHLIGSGGSNYEYSRLD